MWCPTHRHKKRGTTYRLEGFASLQAAEPCEETAVLAIYRGEDGKLWARPHDEFTDGRFEDLTVSSEAPTEPPPSPDPSPIADRVRALIAKMTGVDIGKVTENAAFIEDLGCDSLDLVELVITIEEKFDIRIPDCDAEAMLLVKDAIGYIERAKGGA